MPSLRNPGPWSFAIFACCCLLVGFLYWRGAPDAVKLAGALLAVAFSAFGAKSALAKTRPSSSEPPPPPPRVQMDTWPEDTPDTKRDGGRS